MSGEGALTPREAAERAKARIREEAAAKAAAIDHELAEIERLAALASKYGFVLAPAQAMATPAQSDEAHVPSLTVAALVHHYRTNPESPYRRQAFQSRRNTDGLCDAIIEEIGNRRLADLMAEDIVSFYRRTIDRVAAGGRFRGKTQAQSLIGQLRSLVNFGGSVLKDSACIRVSFVLRDLREQMDLKARNTRRTEQHFITADQAIAIRRAANLAGYPAIALTQALQFDAPFRQRDIIGQWVPEHEEGTGYISTTLARRKGGEIQRTPVKWIRGLQWEHIKQGVIRHTAGKAMKETTFDLRKAPMVKEELIGKFGSLSNLPSSGAVIVDPRTGLPYTDHAFRRIWRMMAHDAGLPDNILNGESRRDEDSEDLETVPEPSRLNGHAVASEPGEFEIPPGSLSP